ncbi:MAG: hypothetical protein V4539_24475 [Bacteroidota bacterium]
MQNRRYYFFLTALLFACSLANAQRAVDAVTKPFDEYRISHLQEKLFVHTDKKFYMAGEIVWFKIYATDAVFNQPFNLSKISYVEILTRENKPVLQAKVALNEGAGNGSFQLPYSVNTGNYILRAYTNWMKNAGAEYYFDKEITIVNALKKSDWVLPLETKNYDVQFFPEGGDLVNGVKSKVAFKILSNGKGISCSGAVLNRRNDTIVRFASLRFGMGQFDLTPDAGEEYHAMIFAGGTMFTKPLPPVSVTGIVMRLTEIDKDRLSLSIQSNKAGSVISLLVHTRQSLKLSLSRELFNGKTEIEIDKKQLGDGISHFTLFNANNQAVCERLYFKRPETLAITATTDAQNYGTRKKVTIDLATNDSKQSAVPGDLSMSVYLLDELQSFESSDILSYLWLQSDLKGFVEEPAYYFSEHGKEADAAADNLMLTQGWRRFRWDDVLQKKAAAIEFLPETEGHIINGRVIDKRNAQPVENIRAYLSVPAEKSLFTGSVSGKNGAIRFNMKDFYGGNEIIVQPNFADSFYRVDIANPFSEKYNTRELTGLALSDKKAALLQHSLHSQVTNAYYGEKQKFLFPQAVDTMPFYGIPDHRYYLDDYTRFITMEEVMREYVGDVRVRKSNEHFNFRIRNQAFENFFETAPLVLFDGVPVFDVDKIIAFDPLKIKRIDVVSQKFFQHDMLHDGIINYSTYQGDLAGYQLDANALIVEYQGLQLQREFYSPVYETPATNSRVPDFRNVLYWSPEVHTSKDGKKQVSFYTADIPGTYGVVIQGITSTGLAGSRTTTFTVTK